MDAQSKRQYLLKQAKNAHMFNGEHSAKHESDEGVKMEGTSGVNHDIAVKDVGHFISGLEPISSDEDLVSKSTLFISLFKAFS